MSNKAQTVETTETAAPRRRCSNPECREVGHNKATCPKLGKTPSGYQKKTRVVHPETGERVYRCKCGAYGHTRNCPLDGLAESTVKKIMRGSGVPKRILRFEAVVGEETFVILQHNPEMMPGTYVKKEVVLGPDGRRQYQCKYCEEHGHNKAGCPKRLAEAAEVAADAAAFEAVVEETIEASTAVAAE